jgi:hypothetical protein
MEVRMLVEGRCHKVGNQWIGEVPFFQSVFSTRPGEERESLFENIKSSADEIGTEIRLHSEDGDTFMLEIDDISPILPMILKRIRIKKRLSIGEVTKLLGFNSRNSYAQYEYGKTKLTLNKFEEIVKAMAPDYQLVLSRRH